MHTLKCGEVHGTECDFVVEATTEQEALERLQIHEEKEHADTLGVLTPEQQAECEKIKRAQMGMPLTVRDEEKQIQDDELGM